MSMLLETVHLFFLLDLLESNDRKIDFVEKPIYELIKVYIRLAINRVCSYLLFILLCIYINRKYMFFADLY